MAYIIEWQKKNLLDYGVKYDTWFSENELRDSGAHREIIDILDKRGFLYKQDGAVWFKSTQFGDDKDRVLVRSSGEETYIVPDLAYHKNKIERGYDLLVDILGPDHHGYVSRLSAGLQALGYPKEILEVKFVQTVRLKRGKEIVKMSKRGGDFVLMEELIDEVGKDACRFFFLDRSPESHLDFDLDLAGSVYENPVFCVQYAHARVASILRQARLESYVISGPKGENGFT